MRAEPEHEVEIIAVAEHFGDGPGASGHGFLVAREDGGRPGAARAQKRQSDEKTVDATKITMIALDIQFQFI